MTTIDFYSFKLGLIKKISEAATMNEISDMFKTMQAEQAPCTWTTEELKAQLAKSEEDIRQGRYLTGTEAINHFKNYSCGG